MDVPPEEMTEKGLEMAEFEFDSSRSGSSLTWASYQAIRCRVRHWFSEQGSILNGG
jgi:hypothetical protein